MHRVEILLFLLILSSTLLVSLLVEAERILDYPDEDFFLLSNQVHPSILNVEEQLNHIKYKTPEETLRQLLLIQKSEVNHLSRPYDALDEIIDVANTDERKCNRRFLDKLDAMLEYYKYQVIKIHSYLSYYVNKQHQLCLEIFSSNFLAQVDSINQQLKLGIQSLRQEIFRAKGRFLDSEYYTGVPKTKLFAGIQAYLRKQLPPDDLYSSGGIRVYKYWFNKKIVNELCQPIYDKLDSSMYIYDNLIGHKNYLNQFPDVWLTNARICFAILQNINTVVTQSFKSFKNNSS